MKIEQRTIQKNWPLDTSDDSWTSLHAPPPLDRRRQPVERVQRNPVQKNPVRTRTRPVRKARASNPIRKPRKTVGPTEERRMGPSRRGRTAEEETRRRKATRRRFYARRRGWGSSTISSRSLTLLRQFNVSFFFFFSRYVLFPVFFFLIFF